MEKLEKLENNTIIITESVILWNGAGEFHHAIFGSEPFVNKHQMFYEH